VTGEKKGDLAMEMDVPEPLVLDLQRRALGMPITALARMTRISYRRLWLTFVDGSDHLSHDERKVLIATLGLEDHEVAGK